jgi:hypothetical protein
VKDLSRYSALPDVSIAPRTASSARLAAISAAIDRFFFLPANAHPLAALRIGVALVLLTQGWLVRHEIFDFLSHDGYVQGELARYLSISFAPHLSTLVAFLGRWGVAETTTIAAAGVVYLVSLLALLVGWRTRLASGIAWLAHWTLTNSTYATNYGADMYAHILLFYLMCVPCGHAWSVDVWRGRVSDQPSWASRLGLRVIQLHAAIAYLASGIEKSTGPQWWNGELLWRALSLPVYRQFDMSWLCHYPWLSRIGGWGTLALELGYIVFIWPKATRKIWVAGIVSLHLGIAIFLGLGVFGCIMAVLTLAVFGFSAEPAPKPGVALS